MDRPSHNVDLHIVNERQSPQRATTTNIDKATKVYSGSFITKVNHNDRICDKYDDVINRDFLLLLNSIY